MILTKKPSFTIESIKQSACGSLNTHLIEAKATKASKYGNQKCVVDDIIFDSQKEAGRYMQLKMLLAAGLISYLKLQVPFELNEGGTHSLKYFADFCYTITDTNQCVVEDCKGYRTKVYLKKRRLMFKLFGITIKET